MSKTKTKILETPSGKVTATIFAPNRLTISGEVWPWPSDDDISLALGFRVEFLDVGDDGEQVYRKI